MPKSVPGNFVVSALICNLCQVCKIRTSINFKKSSIKQHGQKYRKRVHPKKVGNDPTQKVELKSELTAL